MVLQVKGSKEAQAKTLIMRAWRERWTDIQWGIHIRTLIDHEDQDVSFIANSILQQALNGPGPNSLVLSYLMHSIYSQIISTAAVLKSVSQYEGYHKPYCIASLLDLVDEIKDRIILNDSEEIEKCVELAASIASVIHWLLTCMYSSLESLSDLSITDFPADVEDSKIVLKCRNLLEYFLTDPFLSALVHCAVLEDDVTHQNIKKMGREVAKFSDGHHQQDIFFVTGLIDKLGSRGESGSSDKVKNMSKTIDGRQMIVGCPALQSTCIIAALLRSPNEIPAVARDVAIIKDLKSMTNVDLYCELINSYVISLVEAIGKEQELKVISFCLFQLPTLVSAIKENVKATDEDLVNGLKLFLENDSTLNILDSKLNCYTLDVLLNSFHKLNLLSDSDKQNLLQMRPLTVPLNKQVSSNALLVLKAESTLQSVFKTLDGDYVKNQESILNVLCDLLGKSFELILTAAASTGKLQQLTSRLTRLNQNSRQVTGEAGKASATRAMIFDVSFLMLAYIVQKYGEQSLSTEEPECFFIEWHQDCMVESNTVKNPEGILGRCDQNKVEMLLNQYLQGDTELKTSLVFWHELCTNSVGVVRDLLMGWEFGSVTFQEVKKILDVFRSRMCSLPVCISAWLCAHIQMTPEEQSGKARYILNHFLNPVVAEDLQDNFKERHATMCKIINKMMQCIQSSSSPVPFSPESGGFSDSKPVAEMYSKCWKCIESRGLIDIETTTTLKSLLEISGPHHFVQNMVKEMLEIQSSVELLQWSDLLYGIFHIDLSNCIAALVRIVIPSMLSYWNREFNFVEPQLLAIASLTVDCILSYHSRCSDGIKEEKLETSEVGEPSSKRRKLGGSSDANIKSEDGEKLQFMLKELFVEFEKILRYRLEGRPPVMFILRFLEHLSLKTPDVNILQGLPVGIIHQLMSLMCDEIQTKMLLGWYCLSEKSGRANCALSICSLKHMQELNMYRAANI